MTGGGGRSFTLQLLRNADIYHEDVMPNGSSLSAIPTNVGITTTNTNFTSEEARERIMEKKGKTGTGTGTEMGTSILL